eukprot:scaffold17.g501.t1
MQAVLCWGTAPARPAPFTAAGPAGTARPLRLSVASAYSSGPPRTARPADADRPARPGGYQSSGEGSSRPQGGGYRSSSGSDTEGSSYRERRPYGGDRRFRQSSEPSVPINESIRFPEVRVLGVDKSQLGVMAVEEARAAAAAAGVDLVLIVPDASPPVCRLIEYSKYKYELDKAVKDAKKKQRDAVVDTKELKLRPSTDVHDYQAGGRVGVVKLRAAAKFLEKGQRVKLTLQFKGREMEFKQLGAEMFQRFIEDLGEDAAVAQAPQMQGRQMNMVLEPKKLPAVV